MRTMTGTVAIVGALASNGTWRTWRIAVHLIETNGRTAHIHILRQLSWTLSMFFIFRIITLATLAPLANAERNRASDALELCLSAGKALPIATLVTVTKVLPTEAKRELRMAVDFGCGSGSIPVDILNSPPETVPSDVLGAISNLHAGPARIEVFVQPIRQHVSSDLPSILGVAVARVLLHELSHLARRSSSHRANGVDDTRLGPGHLLRPLRSKP